MTEIHDGASGIYVATTEAITVAVEPHFLDEESTPDEGYFVWAYHVRIENNGADTVQLLNRYWKIMDSAGNVHEVHGEGVVGEQPVLAPGEAFEYTSGTPLPTPSGVMMGHYEMASRIDGLRFEVEIPAFSLDSPHQPLQFN